MAKSYCFTYRTPSEFSDIIMKSDGEFLTGLWFLGSKDANKYIGECEEKDLPIFRETSKWLDAYFSGKNPINMPKFKVEGFTPFRHEVSEIMQNIRYGKTATYGDIAKMIAKRRGLKKMSAQAVGGAVGWNPICIIIPCHRVVGEGGKMTGYGGGLPNKIALLKLEQDNRHQC